VLLDAFITHLFEASGVDVLFVAITAV